MIVVPSVSIGNVPQLAVDLLIHTYGFKYVKSLDDEFLAPFIGPMDHAADAPSPPGIATAAQLFKRGSEYLVQLRSPVLTGRKGKFLESLAKELAELDGPVVFVGSANASMSESRGIHTVSSANAPIFPDSGFLNEALTQFPESRAVVSWVHEGDNFPDAEALASELVKLLGFEMTEFKAPVSWNAVYGKKIPLGIEQGLYT